MISAQNIRQVQLKQILYQRAFDQSFLQRIKKLYVP